jgi:hypothetical protein
MTQRRPRRQGRPGTLIAKLGVTMRELGATGWMRFLRPGLAKIAAYGGGGAWTASSRSR